MISCKQSAIFRQPRNKFLRQRRRTVKRNAGGSKWDAFDLNACRSPAPKFFRIGTILQPIVYDKLDWQNS
eukprot:symbB.v1.2.017055.t1/scaffold1314.1/size125707/8